MNITHMSHQHFYDSYLNPLIDKIFTRNKSILVTLMLRSMTIMHAPTNKFHDSLSSHYVINAHYTTH